LDERDFCWNIFALAATNFTAARPTSNTASIKG
jgi:hypothetical protein